jgi:hypothetical protein
MKTYWQIIFILIFLTFVFFLTTIIDFVKYFVFWNFDKDFLDFRLEPIWSKAGIVEIYGGAETGKTLLIVLLTQYLKGRKWSNVACNIPSRNKLTLQLLRKHRIGEYEDGIVGKNNVILIDEPWNFFSKAELKKANLERDLSNILWFMSETSKTDWKVFYVKKQGAKLPDAFNLLSENKTVTIRTLGITNYCSWLKKQYYYLNVELIANNRKTQFGSINDKKDKKTKSKLIQPWIIWLGIGIITFLVGHFGFSISWPTLVSTYCLMGILFWWLSPNKGNTIIRIPFNSRDLELYDKTWNVDKTYEKNRMKGIAHAVKADGLTEGLKLGQSRRQRLREEQEAIAAWKRFDKNRRKQMIFKGQAAAKERGLWKPAEQDIAEQEALLQKQLEEGEITLEDYKIEMDTLLGKRQKWAEAVAKNFPEPAGGEPEKEPKKFSSKKGKGEKIKQENEE